MKMYTHASVPLALAVFLVFPLGIRAQDNSASLPRGSISGTVLLASGTRSTRGIKVEVRFGTAIPWAVVYTTGNGDFQFAELPSGSYTVVVNEPGYDPVQESVTVGVGPAQGLMLYLNKTGSAPAASSGVVVSVRELSIPGKARDAYQKGVERLAKKDLAGSLRHFRRAVTEFPSYDVAYFQLGMALWDLGQQADAEQSFRTAIDVSGGNSADAQFALAALLSDQRRFEEAEKIARRGLLLKPFSWFGQSVLGQALLGLNRLTDAEQRAHKALSLKPDFAVVHILLANIHIRRHEHRALLADLNAYLKLEPNGAYSAQARQTRDVIQQSLAVPENLAEAHPPLP